MRSFLDTALRVIAASVAVMAFLIYYLITVPQLLSVQSTVWNVVGGFSVVSLFIIMIAVVINQLKRVFRE